MQNNASTTIKGRPWSKSIILSSIFLYALDYFSA